MGKEWEGTLAHASRFVSGHGEITWFMIHGQEAGAGERKVGLLVGLPKRRIV